MLLPIQIEAVFRLLRISFEISVNATEPDNNNPGKEDSMSTIRCCKSKQQKQLQQPESLGYCKAGCVEFRGSG